VLNLHVYNSSCSKGLRCEHGNAALIEGVEISFIGIVLDSGENGIGTTLVLLPSLHTHIPYPHTISATQNPATLASTHLSSNHHLPASPLSSPLAYPSSPLLCRKAHVGFHGLVSSRPSQALVHPHTHISDGLHDLILHTTGQYKHHKAAFPRV